MEKTIIKKIKSEMKKQGMTNEKFNKCMGRSARWFSKVKAGSIDMRISDLLKACKILGLSPSSLWTSQNHVSICDMTMKDLLSLLLKKHCDDLIRSNPSKLNELFKELEEIRDKINEVPKGEQESEDVLLG